MFNLIYLFCFIFTLNTYYSAAQQYSACSYDQKCVPLNSCPYMIKYTQPGKRRNIAIVRKSICAFQRTTSFVCCPNLVTPVLRQLPSRSLLPTLCGRPMIQNKIFGGKPTLIGAYPWVVAIGYTEPGTQGFLFECSGSIISERYILTAGHCLHRKYVGRRRFAVVKIGGTNIDENEDCKEVDSFDQKCYRHLIVGFEDVIIHPDFDDEEDLANDIALIRINITLDFSQEDMLIEPVCLPKQNFNVRNFMGDKKVIATGWGLTQFNNYSNVLMSVELPLVSNKHCLERYKSQFVGKQLCAGGERGKDTCLGDSGGPLVLSDNIGPPFIQVGIVSFGQKPCGGQSVPSVYTSVARFRGWIEKNLKP